jgi:predicted nucleic acid-binding Zn ribbon protein
VRRTAPRSLRHALEAVTAAAAPATTLARVQGCWRSVAGEAVAREAEPVAERDGEIVVRCASAVWASELELLGPQLVEGLNAALGAPLVKALRVRGGGSAAGP